MSSFHWDLRGELYGHGPSPRHMLGKLQGYLNEPYIIHWDKVVILLTIWENVTTYHQPNFFFCSFSAQIGSLARGAVTGFLTVRFIFWEMEASGKFSFLLTHFQARSNIQTPFILSPCLAAILPSVPQASGGVAQPLRPYPLRAGGWAHLPAHPLMTPRNSSW